MGGGYFLIDTIRCTACRGCQVACKQWHKFPGHSTRQQGTPENPSDLGPYTYRLVRFREYSRQGRPVRYFFSEACRHCLEPSCKDAADLYVKDAIIIDGTGAVVFTEKTKLLKENAEEVMSACPFNIPRRDPENGLLRKCDMCFNRVKAGLIPICSKTCPSGAIAFGSEKTMKKLAQDRLVKAKRRFGNAARLLNAEEVRAVYLVAADPKKYFEYASY